MIAPLISVLACSLVQTPVQTPPEPEAPKPSDPPAAEPAPKTLVPLPHPLITEVLYAVPTGDTGDANGDGKRSATGDEFVEIVNPHDKPIDLRGYVIADKSMGKPGALKFVFPACKLQPGQIAVVFNGFESSWSGAVGDSMQAPKEGHKAFGGALIFTMKCESSRNAFSNAGDAVCLIAPDGAVVEVVKWGKFDSKLPSAKLTEEAPITNRGSVQRSGIGGKFTAHDASTGTGSAGESVRYSPGRFGKTTGDAPASDPKPEGKPDTKSDPKQDHPAKPGKKKGG